MSLEDLSLVLDRVGEHSGRVDLHGFGEPLLDTELPEKIALLKQRWPQSVPTIYSTLGVHLPLERLRRLVAAGLRHIEVSFYGTDARSYALAHGAERFELAKENLEVLVRLRDELGSPLKIVVRSFPHHDQIKQPGTSEEAVRALHDWVLSLGVELIRERALHNYGSGRAYNPPGQKMPCSVIWGLRYRVLQITWDLDVIPCCFDFNAEVRLGNLRKQTLADIFDSPLYRRFYQAHALDKLEEFPVCRGCERCFEP
jgi:radical SAM protein with 4Fe4S-binding SPASM domain